MKNKSKIALLIFLVLVVGVVLLVIFTRKDNGDTPNAQGNTAQNTKTNVDNRAGINSEDTKTQSANQTTPEQSTQKKTASVIIVDASQYGNIAEVRSYASGVVEAGACTYTFTKDNTIVSKSTPATASASTTDCGTLDVPVSEFAEKGVWSVLVTYSSSTASGSSSKNITIN